MTKLSSINADNNASVTLDNSSGALLPIRPKQIALKSIDDLRLEASAVYRQMRSGQIEASDGTKLIYVLSAIGKLIDGADMEARIEALEAK